jgi:hypothetical protein
MHVSAEKGRSILMKILADLPEEREKLLEEESMGDIPLGTTR